MSSPVRGLAGGLAMLFMACGSSATGDQPSPDSGVIPDGGMSISCSSPAPVTVIHQSVTVNVPADLDATAGPTPTTQIYFTVMLPARCPGDAFPLVLHSHGYGGSRLTTAAASGDLSFTDPHFPAINKLAQALPYHGYVVLSFDERGHGESVPAKGGGYARTIDANAETQDARAILDWAYDHAAEFALQTEPGTGIAKDLKVGTLGFSYGGGYQMPLAALDPRVDTLVPNGTWNDLLYSLLPGNGVKLSFDGLLCLLAQVGSVSNTPVVQTLCNLIGVQGPTASTLRTRDDLVSAMTGPLASPRTVPGTEMDAFFYQHGMRYLETQQDAAQPWKFGESQALLRKVPALFLQGNRDVLFNVTETYHNARYFGSTGADVRVLTTEGGHMNPLANQLEGPANCGAVQGVPSILAWLDRYLKGIPSPAFAAIPTVCISVADTVGAPKVTPVGVVLPSIPIGTQSGSRAVPATLLTLSAAVNPLTFSPVFVPVITIRGSGQVLAGVPRIGKLTVARGTGALQRVAAYVGVGIVRGSSTILVDDQVTSFGEGSHTANAGVNNNAVLLPAIGERLLDGDQVGLLFYQHHVQYSAVLSAASVPGATNVVNVALGTTIPPIASGLDGSILAVPNPYAVTATDIELPILIPGQFPGSSLSQ